MSQLARILIRHLSPNPGGRVALALDDEALNTAVCGLLDTAGAAIVEEGGAHHCLVAFDGSSRFMSAAVRTAVELVSAGGQIVAFNTGPRLQGFGLEPEAYWAPRFRCGDLIQASAGEGQVLLGKRLRTMGNQERKRLRALGHGLDATVLLGRPGLSEEIVVATEAALLRHGIVKVKMTRACELDKRTTFEALAWAAGAEVIHRVGKTAVLYRADVALAPPVKRGGRR